LQLLENTIEITSLSGLVPEEQTPPAAETPGTPNGMPKIKLKKPVNESAIKDQLFNVYIAVGDSLSGIDADTESKLAFNKAKALADGETDTGKKVEKLFLLSQILAETAGAK
jgi:hypothetical protein